MIAPDLATGRAIALVAVAVAALGCVRSADATAPGPLCIPPLLPCPVAPPPPPPPPAPTPQPPLVIGLTEPDPRLLSAGRPGWPGAEAVALRPRYVRVLVDWNRAQPRAGQAPNWDAPPGGCPRTAPRCRSALGLRELLHAIKARRHADGGWQILLVPYFTPAWAATPPEGCQRPGTQARAQMPFIADYRAFLRALQRLADEVGVDVPYWAPWNEPNHPGFLNPQRRICDRHARPLAPELYARLVRAAIQELRPGQQLVLGELAGLDAPRTYGASAPEFVRALPDDVACAGAAFGQHGYVGERGRRGRPPLRVDPASATTATSALLDAVDRALTAHGCTTKLWITETGTFDHRCEAMAAALRTWSDDPRVDAAFQYTFRESSAFPVGLVSSSLRTTYRSYDAWHAFAGMHDAPPADPCG
ncbi:MAG: hypothetical protein QOJ35_4128 [Solirubrobacteraceae bacterium]|jgi:hypothetical protein|nr:hypothetical protein [Solirubrobacteraceae bacterium]